MTIRFGEVSGLIIVFIISARLILCTLRREIGHMTKGSRRLDTYPGNCEIGPGMNLAHFVGLPGYLKGPAARRGCSEACTRYQRI